MTDFERVQGLKAEAPPEDEAPDYHWLCDVAERALKRVEEAREVMRHTIELGGHLDSNCVNIEGSTEDARLCARCTLLADLRAWLDGGE